MSDKVSLKEAVAAIEAALRQLERPPGTGVRSAMSEQKVQSARNALQQARMNLMRECGPQMDIPMSE
jgi:multidrug resistance efflux pump